MTRAEARLRPWRAWLRAAVAVALPHACVLCASARSRSLVCDACAAALPRNAHPCAVCALPLGAGDRCGHCLLHPPSFERTFAPFLYAFPVDRLVQSYKYRGLLACAAWFADAMCACRPDSPGADLLVAMPLAAARQRERGFNQSLELARALSRRTSIPLAVDVVGRVRETRPQAALPWADRARNVGGAFASTADVAGRHVIVVDDVMTTGASLDELARTLKRAGATRVENWIVARTPAPGPRH